MGLACGAPPARAEGSPRRRLSTKPSTPHRPARDPRPGSSRGARGAIPAGRPSRACRRASRTSPSGGRASPASGGSSGRGLRTGHRSPCRDRARRGENPRRRRTSDPAGRVPDAGSRPAPPRRRDREREIAPDPVDRRHEGTRHRHAGADLTAEPEAPDRRAQEHLLPGIAEMQAARRKPALDPRLPDVEEHARRRQGDEIPLRGELAVRGRTASAPRCRSDSGTPGAPAGPAD